MATNSVPRAVPTSVAPSTGHSVSVNNRPQRNSLASPVGDRVVPEVARPDTMPEPGEITPNPGFGGTRTTGMEREMGSAGAPSLPDMNGVLFRKGVIDGHYLSEYQGGQDPYRKVNNPATARVTNWVKDFLNGIATSQDVDNAGWKERHPQQRTSHMRYTAGSNNPGYAPETFTPHQLPQSPNTYKYNPQTGTQPYGSGQVIAGGYQHGRVLNSDAYGAGQTAGGIGGNQYTPAPGPPDTTSTAGNPSASNMPTWG